MFELIPGMYQVNTQLAAAAAVFAPVIYGRQHSQKKQAADWVQQNRNCIVQY